MRSRKLRSGEYLSTTTESELLESNGASEDEEEEEEDGATGRARSRSLSMLVPTALTANCTERRSTSIIEATSEDDDAPPTAAPTR